MSTPFSISRLLSKLSRSFSVMDSISLIIFPVKIFPFLPRNLYSVNLESFRINNCLSSGFFNSYILNASLGENSLSSVPPTSVPSLSYARSFAITYGFIISLSALYFCTTTESLELSQSFILFLSDSDNPPRNCYWALKNRYQSGLKPTCGGNVSASPVTASYIGIVFNTRLFHWPLEILAFSPVSGNVPPTV